MAKRYEAGDMLEWKLPGHVVLSLVEHNFAAYNKKGKYFFAARNFILTPPSKYWHALQRSRLPHKL